MKLSQKGKGTVLVTPVNIPRKGVCTGCGEAFSLGGSIQLGFTVPAHHSKDLEEAKRGVNCSGSDGAPAKVIPHQ